MSYGRVSSFNGRCYVCNDFGPKANLCKSRLNKGNIGQRNDKCYNCNKFGHLVKFCRNKSIKKDNLVKRDEFAKKISVEEVKNEMKMIWKKKENAFAPCSDAKSSSRN